VPEGDTLHRTALVLRDVLAGRRVIAARGRPDGVALGRVVGSTVERVEARGKHLLIGFSNGLTLHTHLRMHGSWHRYRDREPWRRSAARAVAVLEVPGAVAVCFDAPTVELLDSRVVALHPALAALGPDLLAADPDLAEAVTRLRAPTRRAMPIGEALLDQTAQAGLGNVYRSEVCFIERVDPFAPVGELDDATLERLVGTAARLMAANVGGPGRTTTVDALGAEPGSAQIRRPGSNVYVYGRTGRPCRRCGSRVQSRVTGALPRRVYWCPRCQPARASSAADDVSVGAAERGAGPADRAVVGASVASGDEGAGPDRPIDHCRRRSKR
jgi:endonuclease-8